MTAANRQEYVRLYTEWVLNDSISRQFTAFARGFHQVPACCLTHNACLYSFFMPASGDVNMQLS